MSEEYKNPLDKVYNEYVRGGGQNTDKVATVDRILKENNLTANQFETLAVQQGGVDLKAPSLASLDALDRPDIYANKYSIQKSGLADLTSGFYNAAIGRTTEAFKMAIPMTAAGLGYGLGEDKDGDGKISKDEQGWASNWIDENMEWYENNSYLLSDAARTGEGINIFSDEFNANAFAATFGQGLGSVVPVIAASLLAKASGGVLAPTAAATVARVLPFLAGTAQIAPTIIEEGIHKGLTHQEASAVSMVLSPIIGAMEAVGVEKVMAAGTKNLQGSLAVKMFGKEVDNIIASGARVSPQNFKKFSSNIFKNVIDASSKAGKGGALKAGTKALKEEAKLYGKVVGMSALEGSGIEFIQEGSQSLIETLGKEIFDKQFSREGTEKGKGQFGYTFMSEDTFVRAFKEGVLGGLVGGFVSGTGRAATGWRYSSMMDSLDSAAADAGSDTEQRNKNVANVLENIYHAIEENQDATPEQKESMRDMANNMADIAKSGLSQVIKDADARFQYSQLALMNQVASNKIDNIALKGGMFGQDIIAKRNKAMLEPFQLRVATAMNLIVSKGKSIENINDIFEFTDEQVSTLEKWVKDRESAFTEKARLEEKRDGSIAKQKKNREQFENIIHYNSRVAIDPSSSAVEVEAAHGRMLAAHEQVKAINKNIESIERVYEKEIKEVADVAGVALDEIVKTTDINLIVREDGKEDTKEETTEEPVTEEATAEVVEETTAEVVEEPVAETEETERTVGQKSRPANEWQGDKAERENLSTGALATKLVDDPDGAFYGMPKEKVEGLIPKAIKNLSDKIEKVAKGEMSVSDAIASANTKTNPLRLLGQNQIDGIRKFAERKASGEETRTFEEFMSKFYEEETEASAIAGKILEDTTEEKASEETSTADSSKAAKSEVETEAAPTAEEQAQEQETEEMDDLVREKVEYAESLGYKKSEGATRTWESWEHAVSSYNKRVKAGDIKGKVKPVTIESFMEISKEDLEQASLLSESAQQNLLNQQIQQSVADQILAADDVEESEQHDDAEDSIPMDDETKDFISNIIKNHGKRAKKSRLGYKTFIKENPELYNKIKKFLNKVFPKITVQEFDRILDENGVEVLGYIEKLSVGINKDTATQDTIIHEYGHKYVPMLAGTKLYAEMQKLIKKSDFYRDAKLAYKGDTEEAIIEEAIQNLVGTKGVDAIRARVDGSVFEKVVSWLKRFWNTLKYKLGKANAEELGEIVAHRMAWLSKPITEEGVIVEKRTYSRQHTNADLDNKELIRDAYMTTALNLVRKGGKYKKKAIREHFWTAINTVLHNQGLDVEARNKFILKTYKDLINKFEQVLAEKHYAEYEQEVIDDTFDDTEEDVESDELSINQKGLRFETSKLMANTSAILDAMTDIDGNPLDTAKVFNVSTLAASKTRDVSEFMTKLKELADNTEEYDSVVARNLYDALQGMPETVRRPIIKQLHSLDAVPSTSNRMFENSDGNLIDFERNSSQPINRGEAKRFILGRMKSMRYLAYRSSDIVQATRHRKLKQLDMLSTKLWSIVNNNAKTIKVGERTMTEDELVMQVEQLLKEVVGIGIKAKHFWKPTITSLTQDFLNKLKGSSMYTDSRSEFTSFVKAVISQERALYKKIKDNKTLTEQDLSSYLTDIANDLDADGTGQIALLIDDVVKNIASRSSFKRQSRDVLDNMISVDTIGGWANKFFRQASNMGIDAGFSEHPVFKVIPSGKTVLDKYNKVWGAIKGASKSFVHKFDGVKNQTTDTGIKYKNMFEHDVAVSNFLEFLKSRGKFIVDKKGVGRLHEATDTYKQSVGLLADRDFQLLVEAPVIGRKEALELIKEIEAKYKNTKIEEKIGSYIPNMQSAEDSIEYLMDILSDEKINDVHTLKKWRETNVGDTNALQSLVENFVYNDMVNRWFIANMLMADLTSMKSAEDITKRLAGLTTPQISIELDQDLDVFVLDDIQEDGVEFSDSAVFYNDYTSKQIVNAGGSVEQFGNTFKTVTFSSKPNGDFTYIKQAGFGFNKGKGYQDSLTSKERNNINDKGKRQLANMLARFSDRPVAIVFKSAIKSPLKDAKVFKSIDELSTAIYNAERTKTLDKINPSFKVGKNDLAIQLNMFKEVANKKTDMSFGTQMRGILTAFASPEKAMEFESAIQRLYEERFNTRVREKGLLSGAKKAIDRLDNFSANQKGSLGSRIVTFFKRNLKVLPDNTKFDHYDISMKMMNSIANTITDKVSRIKVEGKELVQAPDLSTELKDMYEAKTKEYGGAVTEENMGEVRVPPGTARIGDTVIAYRIPSSSHVSLIVARVVGYTEQGSNRIDMPNNWVKRSDSDHDGDKIFMWKRSATDATEQELFDIAKDVLLDPNVKDKYAEDLDVEKANAWIHEAHKKLGIDSPLEKRGDKYGIKVTDKMSGLKGYMKAAASVKHSSKLIGIFAMTSKMLNYLSSSGIELVQGLSLFGEQVDGKGLGKKVTVDNIDDNAVILQLMLDNTKYLTAGFTGINVQNAGIASTLMTFGHKPVDVIAFMNSAPIKYISERLDRNSNSIFFEKEYGNQDEIIKEAMEMFEGQTVKIDGKRVSAVALIENYTKASTVATMMDSFRKIIMLDRGMPKDIYAVMDVFEAYKTLEREANKQYAFKTIDPIGLNHFRNRPLVRAYKQLLKEQINAYSELFATMPTSLENLNEYSRALKSLKGLNNKKRGSKFQETYTQVMAETIFLNESYANGEAIATRVKTLLDKMIGYKYSSQLKEDENAEFWSYLDIDPTALKLHMNTGRTMPDLDIDAFVDLDSVNRAKLFDKLPDNQRDELVEFAVLTNSFAGHNTIAALFGDTVFFEYFIGKNSYSNRHNEIMDEVAMKLHGELETRKNYNGESEISKGVPTKYFKAKVGNDTVVYKTKPQMRKGKTTGKYDVIPVGTVKPKFTLETTDGVILNEFEYQTTNFLKSKDVVEGQYVATEISADEYFEKYEQAHEGAIADVIQSNTNAIAADILMDKNNKTDDKPDNDIASSILGDIDTQVADGAKTSATRTVQRTLRRMARKHNLNYKVIDDKNIKLAGYFDHDTQTAVVNLAYVKPDTAFHEIIHPFTRAIKESNPELYASLVQDLKSTPEGQKIIADVKRKHKTYSDEKVMEEAVNTALGKEAQLRSEKLITRVKAFFREMAQMIKDLFGVKTRAMLPSQIDSNTTIAQLALAIIQDEVSLDGKIEVKTKRRIAERMKGLQKLFRPGVVLDYMDNVITDDKRTLRRTLSKLGFMMNDNFVVRESNKTVEELNIGFRIPVKMGDNWINSIRKSYPEAVVTDQGRSSILGYDLFYVDLGNGQTVSAYQYNGDLELSDKMSFRANISAQAASSTDPNFEPKDNVFSNATFDKQDMAYYSMDKPNYVKSLATSLFELLRKEYGFKATDEMKALEALSELKYEDRMLSSIRLLVNQVINSYENLMVNNDVFGDMSKLVSVRNFIAKYEAIDLMKDPSASEREALDNYKQNLKDLYNLIRKQEDTDNVYALRGYSQESLDLYQQLLAIHGAAKWLRATQDVLVSTDEDSEIHSVSLIAMAKDTLKKWKANRILRKEWLEKNWLGKPFKKLMDFASVEVPGLGSLNYKYNQLMPETLANIMTGYTKGLLHTILYESPLKGNRRKSVFESTLQQVLVDAFGGDKKLEKIAGIMSTATGRSESELKFEKIYKTEKDGSKTVLAAMPKMRMLTLYKILTQDDLFQRMYPQKYSQQKFNLGKTDGTVKDRTDYGENYEFVLQKYDAEQFIREFETKHKDLVELSIAMDEMFLKANEMLQPTVKKIHGISYKPVANYFPVKYGKFDSRANLKDQSMTLTFGAIFERGAGDVAGTIRIQDALEVVENYRQKAGNYYGYANDIVNMKKLAKEFKREALATSDAETRAELENIVAYIDEYADGLNNYRAIYGLTDKAFDRFMQKLINNFQVAVLGLNPWVMFKQPVSLLAAVPELGDFEVFEKKYLAESFSLMGTSFKKLSLNPKTMKFGELDLDNKIIQEMIGLSEVAKMRFEGYIDREMGEYTQAKLNPYGKKGKKTKIPLLGDVDTSIFLEGIKIFDAAAVLAIYMKVKDDVYNETQSKNPVTGEHFSKEERAALTKERFERIVNKTQPTYDMINRTGFGRTDNQLMRLFTLFSTQRAKNLNMLIDAFNRVAIDPSEEAKAKLKMTLISVGLLSSFSIAGINTLRSFLYGGWDDDEWGKTMAKDMFADTIGTFVGNAYGLGTVFEPMKNYILEKPFGQSIEYPVFQTASQTLKGIGQVGSGKFGKGAYNITNSMFKFYGLPTTPLTVGRKIGSGVSSLASSE